MRRADGGALGARERLGPGGEFPGGHAELRGYEFSFVELAGELGNRLVTANPDGGDDLRHGGLHRQRQRGARAKAVELSAEGGIGGGQRAHGGGSEGSRA